MRKRAALPAQIPHRTQLFEHPAPVLADTKFSVTLFFLPRSLCFFRVPSPFSAPPSTRKVFWLPSAKPHWTFSVLRSPPSARPLPPSPWSQLRRPVCSPHLATIAIAVFLGWTASERQRAIFATEGHAYRPEWLVQPTDVAQLLLFSLQLPRTSEITDLVLRPMQKT